MSSRLVFGPFDLDMAAFRLLRDGAPVELQPKALELLIVLLRAGGALVEQAQLRSALWPDVVVTEQSLRQVLLKLRQSLGEHQDYVETIPRRGLRYAGPPPRTPEAPVSVPAERDRLVGLGKELGALAERLGAGARLVTVLGPGGVGKTRLALHFARNRQAGGASAWFCDLSAAWTLDAIAAAVASALELPLDTDPIARIGRGLAHRGDVLIVLDNFEQVASLAQESVGRWLDAAPAARFVVTSRSALGLVGEHVLQLDPLAPDDAATLFAERSAAAGSPVSADDPAVRSLVGLLDHLPLAIELAAARGRVLSPSRLVERISERLDLLKSTTRGVRHATLRATLDWSWELSSADERAALAALAVFDGPSALAAAEDVIDVRGQALDVLSALVDRSWIRRTGDDQFELLSTVRAYAEEKLDVAARRAAEIRHGRWYAASPPSTAPRALPNLVAAVQRAARRGDGELAAELLERAWHGLEVRGPFPLGLALATEVLALPLPLPAAGRAALAAGAAARLCGRGTLARQHFGAALAAAAALGDRALEASALVGLAVVDAQEGRVDSAEPLVQRARAIRQALEDPLGEAQALHDLAGFALHRGALAEAERSLRTALALLAPRHAPWLVARTLASLGAVLVAARRLDEARVVVEAALEAHRAGGWRRGESVALRNLGNVYIGLAESERALDCYERALQIAGELGDLAEVGVIRGNLGNLHRTLGAAEAARVHLEEALRIAREISDSAFEGWILGRLGRLEAAEGRTSDALARFDAAEVILAAVGHTQALHEVRAHRAEVLERTRA